MLDIAVCHYLIPLLRPLCDLLNAAARILVKRNVEALDELRILRLYVEGVILSVVLAGLGTVVAELVNIVKAYHIAVLFGCVHSLCLFLDDRIEVTALLIAHLEKPSHMVYSGDKLRANLGVIHTEAAEELLSAYLNAVAKTYGLYLGVTEHIAGKNSHRVGVVEEPRIGANLLHIARKVLEHVNGTHTSHNSADAESVGNGLSEAVLLGYLKVDDGTGVVKADLDRVNDESRTAERIASFSNAEVLLYLSLSLVVLFVKRVDHQIGLLESYSVDIVKSYLEILAKRGSEQNVTENVLGKYRAACAHKCNFHTFSILSSR